MMMMLNIGTDILPPNHQCGVAMPIGCRVVPICCLNRIDVTNTNQNRHNKILRHKGHRNWHPLGIKVVIGSIPGQRCGNGFHIEKDAQTVSRLTPSDASGGA